MIASQDNRARALQLAAAIYHLARMRTIAHQIAQNGHAVSVIYGALPPEVRRREAVDRAPPQHTRGLRRGMKGPATHRGCGA